MHQYWLMVLCIGISSMFLRTESFEFEEILNTSNGFCETEQYGRIPVGTTAYGDEQCVKVFCRHNRLITQGCGVGRVEESSGCRLVRGEGRYPNCCPRIDCS